MSEIEKRAQDKFTAAIYRRNRAPLALQIAQEHFADLGFIQKQAERNLDHEKASQQTD